MDKKVLVECEVPLTCSKCCFSKYMLVGKNSSGNEYVCGRDPVIIINERTFNNIRHPLCPFDRTNDPKIRHIVKIKRKNSIDVEMLQHYMDDDPEGFLKYLMHDLGDRSGKDIVDNGLAKCAVEDVPEYQTKEITITIEVLKPIIE